MQENTAIVLLHEALTRCKHIKNLSKIFNVENVIAEIEAADLVPTHEGDHQESLAFATAQLVKDNSFNIEGIVEQKKLVVY